ncbi:hypothetical protein L873DRAFT_432883 [Choiromyces venosus 120613-1]|uniref:Secreted protein n=1 Tax=Choiromyces venosus 120613-1 TaxID=1336337 RepID=A0A3N4J9P1_9PEZI|nr:hypothetical protein L873DRAFT_432883 [Choiromyces venosus 120613-1]
MRFLLPLIVRLLARGVRSGTREKPPANPQDNLNFSGYVGSVKSLGGRLPGLRIEAWYRLLLAKAFCTRCLQYLTCCRDGL